MYSLKKRIQKSKHLTKTNTHGHKQHRLSLPFASEWVCLTFDLLATRNGIHIYFQV